MKEASAEDGTGDDEPRPRSTFRLLIDRTFGPYYVGRSLSAVGMWVQNITSSVVVWNATGSPIDVGIVVGAQFVGTLVLSLWAGVLADRWDRRLVLAIGRSISMVASLLLVAAVAFAPSDVFVQVLAFISLVSGIGVALSSPAMHAVIPSLVPRVDLDRAISLNSLVGSLARTVGPAFGGILFLVGGPILAYGFSAFGHAAFAAAALTIPRSPRPQAKKPPRLLEGLAFVRADPNLGAILAGAAVLCLGVDVILTLGPALTVFIDLPASATGILVGVFGIGSVIAGFIAPRLRDRGSISLRTLSLWGLGMQTVSLAALALNGPTALAFIALAVAGAGFLLSTTSLNSNLQRRIPEFARGRVMSVWSVAFLGTRPIAALANGFIAESLGIVATLVIGAGITLIGFMIIMRRLSPDT